MRKSLAQKVEGDEPPWTEDMGCLSFTPSDVGYRHTELLQIGPSTSVPEREMRTCGGV